MSAKSSCNCNQLKVAILFLFCQVCVVIYIPRHGRHKPGQAPSLARSVSTGGLKFGSDESPIMSSTHFLNKKYKFPKHVIY